MMFTRERAFARTFLAGLHSDEELQREVVYTIASALERYDTGPYKADGSWDYVGPLGQSNDHPEPCR